MTTPTAPCYAIFHGIRHNRRLGRIETIHAPVHVEWVWVGARKELGVAMCGRQARYALASFEGSFTPLVLEEVTP